MENSLKLSKIESKIVDKYNYNIVHIYAEQNNKAADIITQYKPGEPITKNDTLLINAHNTISNLLYERIVLLENDKINFITPEFKKEADLLKTLHNTHPLVVLSQLEKLNLSIEPTFQEIKKMYNPNSTQNEKVDIKINLNEERLSEYNHPISQLNDSIDKSIKIPDRNEIAQNPNKFEAEKGIDTNGVNEAPAKSVNTIAEDYIKGQEKDIQQRISLADHFSDNENKISHKI